MDSDDEPIRLGRSSKLGTGASLRQYNGPIQIYPQTRQANTSAGLSFNKRLKAGHDADSGLDPAVNDWSEGSDTEDSDPEYPEKLEDRRTWGQRKAAEDRQWKENMSAFRSSWIAAAPARASCKLVDIEHTKVQVQSKLDAHAKSQHAECLLAGAVLFIAPESQGQVEYVGLACRTTVAVNKWCCNVCSKSAAPDPIAVGLFPSTPVQPRVLFDMTLLDLYRTLQRSGTKMDGFLRGLHTTHTSWLEEEPLKPLDSELFSSALVNYGRMLHRATSPSTLGITAVVQDPFSDCPICARLTGEPSSSEYCRVCCADAVTKLSHYSNVGKATCTIQPHLSTYFGPVQAAVQDLRARNLLSLSGIRDAVGSGGGPVTTPRAECSTLLHCAREDAPSTSGSVDVYGVVGWVCAHGMPLVGMFCDMPTSEMFCYYIIGLHRLLRLRPGQMHVYVDFACRLASSADSFMRALPEHYTMDGHVYRKAEIMAAWQEVKMYVNWMHGSSHKMSCQLQHCGRFQLNAAHVVGEQTEQLWSNTKDIAAQTRYMQHARRSDTLEMLLESVGEDKVANAPKLLSRQHASMVEKQGVCAVQSTGVIQNCCTRILIRDACRYIGQGQGRPSSV